MRQCKRLQASRVKLPNDQAEAHPKRLDGEFSSEVVVWVPLGDELSPFAPSLEAFLDGWVTGALQIR